jgi:hypothetical protein
VPCDGSRSARDWSGHSSPARTCATSPHNRNRSVYLRTSWYDAAPDGAKGALLRREGLYSSLITEWRRARDAGALAGLKQPRGRPAADPRDAQIARLTREKAKLEQELATSRFVVEVQAKLQALLEKLSEGADNRQGPTP